MKNKIELFTLDYEEYNEGSVLNLIEKLQTIIHEHENVNLLYELEERWGSAYVVFYRWETDEECSSRIARWDATLKQEEIERLNYLKAKYEGNNQ